MNKTPKNTPDRPGVWEAAQAGTVAWLFCGFLSMSPRGRGQGNREERAGFSCDFFSFPLLGPNIKERKGLTDRQERAKAERERDRGVAAAADRHWPAVRGRANRDARDSRAPTRVRAPRGGQGGSRAAPANPASPRLRASLSPEHLAHLPARPPLPSKALTPRENRPVDLCRNIRPLFSKENVPQLCEGGWQYISNSGLSF